MIQRIQSVYLALAILSIALMFAFKVAGVSTGSTEAVLTVYGATLDQQPLDLALMAVPPYVFNIEKFKPGTLTANAFIDGKAVATDSVCTPSQAAAIRLEVDLSGIPINTEFQDVVFVYASIMDENGTLVKDANDFVEFVVEGNAKLIGDNPAQAKAGIATILLQTNGLEKAILIKASAADLRVGEIQIDKSN